VGFPVRPAAWAPAPVGAVRGAVVGRPVALAPDWGRARSISASDRERSGKGGSVRLSLDAPVPSTGVARPYVGQVQAA
jgi:hypothetical protein